MINLGDRAVGSTLSFLFNTHKADGTPITLAGTPVVSVYKNSTTQSVAGVSLTVDYDGVTGMHQVVIDTSADGAFYATGNDFNVAITTGTVNSISVAGAVVGKFSIGRQNVSHITSTAQTARDIGASVLLSSGTGTGQLDFTSGIVKANLMQILGTLLTETGGYLAAGFKKFFNIAVPVHTVGSVDQTGDSFARIGAPVGASISADIAADKSVDDAIKLKTDLIPASPASTTNITGGTITTVTNLTNAPTNGDLTAAMKASVTAAVPTVGNIDTQLSGTHGSGAWDGVGPSGVDIVSINGSPSAAAKLALSADTEISGFIDDSTLDPTTTEFETSLIEGQTNQFKDRWLAFASAIDGGGINAGCAKPIVSYQLSGGKGRFITYAFPSAPAGLDVFVIV